MLKKKLEALLFSSGRKMSIEELSRLSNARTGDIQTSLEELKKEYGDKGSSVIIVNEGDSWKLTVHEDFLPLVQKIITETELSKTIIETLAVIAFKYPIKQSDLIRIRTNKAYDHLKELEGMGYITRQKHGRTNLIKLTEKFFEYFNLPQEKLKETFRDFGRIAKAIEEQEIDIKRIKEEQKASAEEEKKKAEEVEKGVLLDEDGNKLDLEKVKSKEEDPKTEVIEEKLGDLNIVDEPSEEKLEEERERIEHIQEEEKKEQEKPQFEGEGIKLSKEEEKAAEEKAEKILHPGKEQEDKKETEETDNKEEEPKDLLESEMEDKDKNNNQ
jgi:segregation and condensation protein B